MKQLEIQSLEEGKSTQLKCKHQENPTEATKTGKEQKDRHRIRKGLSVRPEQRVAKAIATSDLPESSASPTKRAKQPTERRVKFSDDLVSGNKFRLMGSTNVSSI